MTRRDVREVIHAIGKAQRGYGLGDVQPPRPFIVVAFYLDPEDLKQIRPHLTLNPGQPDRNQVGRYGSVAVFPFDARGMASLHCIFFDGVYFEYVPMDVVD